jgi:hypothetical protein
VVYPSRVPVGPRVDGQATAFPETDRPHVHGVPVQVHATACEALSPPSGAMAVGGGAVVVVVVVDDLTVSVVGWAVVSAAGSACVVPSATQAVSAAQRVQRATARSRGDRRNPCSSRWP